LPKREILKEKKFKACIPYRINFSSLFYIFNFF